MKNNILTFLMFITALLIQIFFNEYIGICGAKPDLILIALLISVSYINPIFLVFLGFLFGLMQDWLMLTPLIGLSPLLKIIFVFSTVKSVQRFKTFPNIILISVKLLLLFLYFVFYNSISLLRAGLSFSNIILNYSIPEFIYTAILFFICYFIIRYNRKDRE